MRWRKRIGAFLGILGVVGALSVPATATAEVTLAEIKAHAGGNGVRISGTVQGNEAVNDLAVVGSYQADVTNKSSHPPGDCRDFNATQQQPVVGCDYPPPGLAPGTRFFVDLQGTAPCAPGRGFTVQAQNNTSGNDSQEFVPCTQSPGADLGLTLAPASQAFIFTSFSFFDDEESDEPQVGLKLDLSSLFVTAKVTNHGPATAEQVELQRLGPAALPPKGRFGLSDRDRQAGVRCAQEACEFGNVAAGESRLIVLKVDLVTGGYVAVQFIALSSTYDPGPKPHQASYVDNAALVPDSKVTAAALKGVEASMRGGATNVRVAVVRTAGGAQVIDDGTYAGGSAASCKWLRSVRGRFKRQRGRNCNRPVWLKAKRAGRRRARLRFRRPLPPGRYTVLTSAVGKRGAAESTFSKRDGNRSTFTVRKR